MGGLNNRIKKCAYGINPEDCWESGVCLQELKQMDKIVSAADELAKVVREAMKCLRNGLPCCMDNCEGKSNEALAAYEKARGTRTE